MTQPTDSEVEAVGAPKVSPLIEVIGWLGTALIVGAYGLLSQGVIETGDLYQCMNLAGAIGVGLVCWVKRTWQPFALELVWGIIALLSLLR